MAMRAVLSVLLLCAVSALGQHQVYGPDYIAKSAAEKQDLIWENVNLDTSSNSWPGISLAEIFFEDMCVTLYQDGDELPVAWTGNTRRKYIHSVGSVGKVEFVSNGEHPYTGIFQGASHGIIRISLAKEPSASSLNTAPGMGLKFLRDGLESASMVAMYSVDGQESWNVFANDWTNHIAPATGALVALGAKFATATPYIQQVGLSDFARAGEDGAAVEAVNYPYKLVFRPTGELSFADEYHGPFTDDLASIPADSVLWNVFAWDAPAELGGQEQLIGDLVLRSEMTTSLWGDAHLFFRHQNMIEDFVLHPEWEQYTDSFYVPGGQSCFKH